MPNITIVESAGLAVDPRTGARLPYPAVPPLAQQVLVLSSSNQQSNVFHPRTQLVTLISESVCRVALGASPDAAASGFLLAAGAERTYPVSPGARLAVIDGVPLPTPLFTSASTLNPNVAGSTVTWTSAAATDSTVTYSLRKNGVQVATSSGSYSATSEGDILQLHVTATNAAGAKSTILSSPVTVTPVVPVAPTITTAPVLSGGGAVGQAITLTPGTATGTPAPFSTFSWRDAGGNELSTSASAFTPVAAGQITVVQKASNGVGSAATRMSNTVVVATADPYMLASSRLRASAVATVGSNPNPNQYTADAVVFESPPYPVTDPRFIFTGWYNQAVEGNCGNDQQILGFSMMVNDVVMEFTYQGSKQFVIPDDGEIMTDSFGDGTYVLPANSAIKLITINYVPTGGKKIIGFNHRQGALGKGNPVLGNKSDGRVWSNTAWTDAQIAQLVKGQNATGTGGGSWAVTTSSSAVGCCPYAMVGKGWAAAGKPPVVMVEGASVGAGQEEINYQNLVDGPCMGHISRALYDNSTGKRRPHWLNCQQGAHYSDMVEANYLKRARLANKFGRLFTDILVEMGGSDGNSHAGVAPAIYAMLKRLFNNPRIGQTTTLVHAELQGAGGVSSNSLIGFTTLEDQLPDDRSIAQASIRGLVAGQDYFIEQAGYIESDKDSFKFGVASQQRMQDQFNMFEGTLAVELAAGTAATVVVTGNKPPELYSALQIKDNRHLGVVTAITGTGPWTCTIGAGTYQKSGALAPVGSIVREVWTRDGTHLCVRGFLAQQKAVMNAKEAGKI